MEITEVIGWIDSLLIIIAFFNKSKVYRTIATIGFLVYTIMIQDVQLILIATLVVGMNVYDIWKIRKEERKKKFPWLYPIEGDEEWKDTPPIVSSLEIEEDDEFIEDPFVS